MPSAGLDTRQQVAASWEQIYGTGEPYTPRQLERVTSHPIAFESDTPQLVSPAQPSAQTLLAGGDPYSAAASRNARSVVVTGALPPHEGYGKPSEATRASVPVASPAAGGGGGSTGSPMYPYNPPAGHDAPLTSTSAEMLAKRMNLGGYMVNPTPTTSVFPTPATSVNPTPAVSTRPSPQPSPMKLPRWAANLSLSQRASGQPTGAPRARRTLGGAFGSVTASAGKPTHDDPMRQSVGGAPPAADGRQVLGDIPTNRPLPSCAEDAALTYSLAQAQAAAVSKAAAMKSPEISDSSVLYAGSGSGSGSASGSAYNSPEHLPAYSSAGATPALQSTQTPYIPPSNQSQLPTPSTGERGVGYWAERADYWQTRLNTKTSQQFLPGSLAGLLAMPRAQDEGPIAPANSWAARKQLSQSLDSEALRMAAARTTPLKLMPSTSPPPAQPAQGSPSRLGRSLAPEDMPLTALPGPERCPDPIIDRAPIPAPAGRASVTRPPLGATSPDDVHLSTGTADLGMVASSVAKIKESLRASQEAGHTLNPEYCDALESELGKLQATLETFRKSTSQQPSGVEAPPPPAVPEPAIPPAVEVPQASQPPAAATPQRPTSLATSQSPKAKSIGCFACMFPSKNKSQQ